MRVAKLCILGGSGFVGRSLASRLISSGHKLRVITRSREHARDLWVLPGLELIEGDVHDSRLLGETLQGCDALVNLIGILNERKDDGSGFRRAHIELAQRAVEACRTAG